MHFDQEPVIEPLTSKQRAYLRAQSHPLKPILHIGKEGVTNAAVQAVAEAFNTRELLKVKVLEAAPQPARASGDALAQQIEHAQVVLVIGRTVVLYRLHPETPKLHLPPT